MAKIIYPASSPYTNTPQSSRFIGVYKHRSIPANSEDKTYVLEQKYNQRPDLLSYDLYGTPVYWWVFYSRNINVIRDPIFDFTTGKEIILPSASHIKRVLGG